MVRMRYMQPGTMWDIRDLSWKWVAASVRKVDDNRHVRVHYLDWSSTWDETIDANLPGRPLWFAPLGKYSSKGRVTSVKAGDQVCVAAAVAYRRVALCQ